MYRCLEALGWDVFDPQTIATNEQVRRTEVDVVLRSTQQNIFLQIVEEGHSRNAVLRKLTANVENENEIAAIWLFDRSECTAHMASRVDSDKLIFKANFGIPQSDEIVTTFVALLGHESVMSGEAQDGWNQKCQPILRESFRERLELTIIGLLADHGTAAADLKRKYYELFGKSLDDDLSLNSQDPAKTGHWEADRRYSDFEPPVSSRLKTTRDVTRNPFPRWRPLDDARNAPPVAGLLQNFPPR